MLGFLIQFIRGTKGKQATEKIGLEVGPVKGSEIGILFDEIRSDPAWTDPLGLVMQASFSPSTYPICLVADGERFPSGSEKTVGHCRNCTCYLLPYKWRQPMRDPNAKYHEATRIAEGDQGEELINLKVTAEEWLRANPETAKRVLGDEIAESFLGKSINGLPIPPITLHEAACRWTRAVRDPILEFEKLSEEGAALYKNRSEPGVMDEAIRKLEATLPLLEAVMSAYQKLEIIEDGQIDKIPRWGAPFRQLAIIYEKQGRFTDAVSLCRRAEAAGWGGDWVHRIERIGRKQLKR